MNYISTRGFKEFGVTSAEAIKRGLAPDGGLYMPESMPNITEEFLNSLLPLSYAERSAAVLSLFLTDYTKQELIKDASLAYAKEKFGASPAPVAAFRDMHVYFAVGKGGNFDFAELGIELLRNRLCQIAVRVTGKQLNFIAVSYHK